MKRISLKVLPAKNLLLLTIFFFYCFPAITLAVEKKVPVSLLKWPGQGADYAILVDKKAQKVFVYKKGHLTKPVKEYRCSSGENSGPKLKKNDKRTPEGIYFFTNSFVDKDLTPIYGVRAFPIDYPNSLDTKEGRGGYGIWFHGSNKPLKPRDSNGCIVLANGSIDDLASFVELNDTPVIISEKRRLIPYKKLERESEKMQRMIEQWRSSWENKKIDKYMGFYSTDFSAKWKDWNGWKAYKARLAKKYQTINVKVDNLQIYKTNGIILAKFKQTYQADNFLSVGEKRLFFKKNSSEWKIVTEAFFEDQAGQETLAKKQKKTKKEIRKFVNSWKDAWQKKNLKAYLACYDRKFQSKDMDLNAWKKYKTRLNLKYRSLSVRLSQLRIAYHSGTTATVFFNQDYRADAYHDFGEKQLSLVKMGKQWKIRKETWQVIR